MTLSWLFFPKSLPIKLGSLSGLAGLLLWSPEEGSFYHLHVQWEGSGQSFPHPSNNKDKSSVGQEGKRDCGRFQVSGCLPESLSSASNRQKTNAHLCQTITPLLCWRGACRPGCSGVIGPILPVGSGCETINAKKKRGRFSFLKCNPGCDVSLLCTPFFCTRKYQL